MKHRLRAILNNKGLNQNDLAEFLGVTYQTISIKMNGHKEFTQSEIFKIMVAFELTPEQVVSIFLNPEYKFTS